MTELVFDTSCLTHLARADRLHVLEAVTHGYDRLVPDEVMTEVQPGIPEHPHLGDLIGVSWLTIIELDITETVRAVEFKRELGGAPAEHLGECAVLAAAQSRAAIAVIDDRDGAAAGERHGITAAGTFSLLARGLRDDLITERTANETVDELRATEMRLPDTQGDFVGWTRTTGLLP